jgi:hypothetical protein
MWCIGHFTMNRSDNFTLDWRAMERVVKSMKILDLPHGKSEFLLDLENAIVKFITVLSTKSIVMLSVCVSHNIVTC